MSTSVLASLVFVCLLLVLLLLQLRKLYGLSSREADLSPVLNGIAAVEKGQEQVERSVRDEIAQSRHEESTRSQALRGEVVTTLIGIGNSVSTDVDNLTRSNDQRLELLRSSMEQRLDSFTTESSRKTDGLTQTVEGSTASVRAEDGKRKTGTTQNKATGHSKRQEIVNSDSVTLPTFSALSAN